MNQSLGIIQNVQKEIENNIDKALTPFLGMDNFRASVTAKLNTDTQQIQETVFDPESRVERSTRVTSEQQKSSQQQPDNAATVQAERPAGGPDGRRCRTSVERPDREEGRADKLRDQLARPSPPSRAATRSKSSPSPSWSIAAGLLP